MPVCRSRVDRFGRDEQAEGEGRGDDGRSAAPRAAPASRARFSLEAVAADMKTHTRAWEEAVRSLGIEPTPRPRPSPLQWLWYAFWGPLPDRYRLWVLYDATCSTWILRHVARILTIAVVPMAAVVVFLPGPLHLRLLTALVAGAGAFLFTVVWVNEATESRLVRAGWGSGTGEQVRERRSLIREWIGRVRRL
jgi:hypothetical protein